VTAVRFIVQPIPGRNSCSADSPHTELTGEMVLYDVLSLPV
jgi:hypothetical protein